LKKVYIEGKFKPSSEFEAVASKLIFVLC